MSRRHTLIDRVSVIASARGSDGTTGPARVAAGAVHAQPRPASADYIKLLALDIRNGTSHQSAARAISTGHDNKRRSYSAMQIRARFLRAAKATVKKLKSEDFVQIAVLLRDTYAFHNLDGWEHDYRHWMFGTHHRDYARVVAEIDLVAALEGGTAPKFSEKAFEILTDWFNTTDAHKGGAMPDLTDTKELARVRQMPLAEGLARRAMQRGTIGAAHSTSKAEGDAIVLAAIAMKNQQKADALNASVNEMLSRMNRGDLSPEDSAAMLADCLKANAALNTMIEEGSAVRPLSDDWRRLQQKVIALNIDTGGGKTNMSLNVGLKLVEASIQFAATFHSNGKVREYYADARKLAEGDGSVAAAVERIVYRPGLGAPSLEVHDPLDGTPSKFALMKQMCDRADEVAVLGASGIVPTVMCDTCVFAAAGTCEWQAFQTSETYMKAIGILGAGADWLNDPNSLGADESEYRAAVLFVDDMPLSSYFESYEISPATFTLPTIFEALGKEDPDTVSHGEYELRRMMADAVWALSHNTKDGFVRDLRDANGVLLREKYDGMLLLDRLENYCAIPSAGRGKPGYAFSAPVQRVLGLMGQVETLKAFVRCVIGDGGISEFCARLSSDTSQRKFYGPRWSFDFDRRNVGGKGAAKVTAILTVVKDISRDPRLLIAILDGTLDRVVMQALLDRRIEGADQPRIRYGSETFAVQFTGSMNGKGKHTPPDDKDEEELRLRRSKWERQLARCEAAERTGNVAAADVIRLEAARKHYAELKESIARRYRTTKGLFVAASRRAIELSASGKELLVVTHKAQCDRLERMTKMVNGHFHTLSFGLGRGLNVYQKVSEVWIVGRPGVQARQALRYAAAMTNEALDVEEFDHDAGVYWMTDGSVVPAPMQEVLTHDLANRVIAQLVAAEIYQALNRIRPTTRQDEELNIVVFTRTAIPWLFLDKVVDQDPLAVWGYDAWQWMMTLVPDRGAEGGVYAALAAVTGNTLDGLKKKIQRCEGGTDAFRRMVALAEDGTLRREGWGHFRVTVAPKTGSGRAQPVSAEGWMPYRQGDVQAASEALAWFGATVVSVEAIPAQEVGMAGPDAPGQKIPAHCPERDENGSSAIVYHMENDPVGHGVGTVSGNYSDPLDRLIASGDAPLYGMKAYIELAEFLLGGALAAKTIRNRVSKDAGLKARWQAAASVETITHRVTVPGGRYSTHARLSDATAAALEAKGCDVRSLKAPTPPDGGKPRRGRPKREHSDGGTAGATPATAPAPVPPVAVAEVDAQLPAGWMRFTNPAAARATHLRRDALGLAEMIREGRNNLELIGFDPAEAEELLAMARAMAAEAGASPV